MTNEQQLLLKIANVERAMSKMTFSHNQAKRLLGVGQTRLAELINKGDLRLFVDGKTKTSTWRISGQDIFHLILEDKAQKKININI